MRSLLGLLLVGSGLAALALYMPQDQPLSSMSVQNGDVLLSAGGPRTFSPSIPLVATAASDVHIKSSADVVPAPGTRQGGAPISADVAPLPPAPVSALRVARTSSTSGVDAEPAPTAVAGKDDLVRSLQRELRRVGCYRGEITGDWTAATRSAMSAFNERVNAALPTDKPDYILLTLVQGHPARACGTPCPTGQVANGEHCVPAAIMAQGRTKSTETRSADAGIVQPRLLSPPSPATRSRWSETVVTQTTPPVASVKGTPSLPTSAPASVGHGPVEPLPGRMAVGAGTIGAEHFGATETASGQAAGSIATAGSGVAMEKRKPRTEHRTVRPQQASREGPAKTWAAHIFNN